MIKHLEPFPENEAFNGDQNRCNICGRKLGKRPFMVEVVQGGLVHNQKVGQADMNDAGYMGAYPVGSECAKIFESGIAIKVGE